MMSLAAKGSGIMALAALMAMPTGCKSSDKQKQEEERVEEVSVVRAEEVKPEPPKDTVDHLRPIFESNKAEGIGAILRTNEVRNFIVGKYSGAYYQMMLKHIKDSDKVIVENGSYVAKGRSTRDYDTYAELKYNPQKRNLDILFVVSGRKVPADGEVYDTSGWAHSYYKDEFDEYDRNDPFVHYPARPTDEEKLCVRIDKNNMYLYSYDHFKAPLRSVKLRNNITGKVYDFSIAQPMEFREASGGVLYPADSQRMMEMMSVFPDYTISMQFWETCFVVVQSKDHPDLRHAKDAVSKYITDALN